MAMYVTFYDFTDQAAGSPVQDYLRDTNVRIKARTGTVADFLRQILDLQTQSLGEDIGLATVYRVLTQFESAGLVTRHNFEGGHSVFELDDGDHHDHMVCVDTGEVIEFTNEDIERLQERVAGELGFRLIGHRLELFGVPLKPTKDEETK